MSYLQQRIERVFQEVFENDGLSVNDDTSFETMPEWDSVSHVKLIIAMEEEFGVKFDTSEVVEASSAGAFRELLEAKGAK